jgi:signal transduction histidine kinase
MQTRRSIRLPIALAVVMIVMLVALTVGWVLLAVRSAFTDSDLSSLYWVLLSVGSIFFALIVVGVVIYLTLSIKAINITRRQSNFIDSVTHELKSPIASLKLYLQTLTRRQVTQEEQAEFYRSMLEDVDRLDQLINHVLDAARLDKPRQETVKQAVRLDELIENCAEQVCQRHRVPAGTIDLKLKPSCVRAPQVDLELIFRNLLDNAVKYAGDPPSVEVTLSQSAPDRISVRVTDNGRGIPTKHRGKVFGRFERLGTELEREKPGLGLGLFIARTLVARLRGRIRIRETGAESGTTFEVTLPGAIVSESQESRPETASAL